MKCFQPWDDASITSLKDLLDASRWLILRQSSPLEGLPTAYYKRPTEGAGLVPLLNAIPMSSPIANALTF